GHRPRIPDRCDRPNWTDRPMGGGDEPPAGQGQAVKFSEGAGARSLTVAALFSGSFLVAGSGLTHRRLVDRRRLIEFRVAGRVVRSAGRLRALALLGLTSGAGRYVLGAGIGRLVRSWQLFGHSRFLLLGRAGSVSDRRKEGSNRDAINSRHLPTLAVTLLDH